MSKIVIIGGVAGGAGVAARLRRLDEKAEIILLEKGEYISYANCGLPYYIGDTITQREKLFVQTVSGFRQRFRIDIRTRSEAVGLFPERKTILIRETGGGREYEESYDKLVLSPGASPIVPDIPGINIQGIFTLRDVHDMDRIKKHIMETGAGNALIVGGGFIGLEMAENLTMAGLEVDMVEKTTQVMPSLDPEMANHIHRKLHENGISLHLGCAVTEFVPCDDGIEAHLENGERIRISIVLLCMGVRPNIALAKEAGLRIGSLGGIEVNGFMQTSDPDIYALGDAVEIPHLLLGRNVLLPLAGPANKEARITADNLILGNHRTYKGCIGSSITKVFDLQAATVGLTEKQLKREGLPYIASHTHSASHASYYPSSKMMDIKLLFHPESGRIWGAQIIGAEGADKRIEMIAQTILHGGTVNDLCEAEQAYAPPFSSAKDPVNMAGFVAENILSGRCRVIQWDEWLQRDPSDLMLLDVRTTEEYRAGHLPNAVNMELDHIREQLDQLPKDKDIVLYCAIGLRAYVAYRILAQNGFTRIANLSGGYRTCHTAMQRY